MPTTPNDRADTPLVEIERAVQTRAKELALDVSGPRGESELRALIAVPLFAVVYLIRAARSRIVLAGLYALASWLFIYGLFDRALRIPLPTGVLFVS